MFSDLLIYSMGWDVMDRLFYILWKIVGGVVVGGIGWSGQGEREDGGEWGRDQAGDLLG